MESSSTRAFRARRAKRWIGPNYLLKNAGYLKYDMGFPIATGVIEGACRYLVKDRMEVTGARWSLAGGGLTPACAGQRNAYWKRDPRWAPIT